MLRRLLIVAACLAALAASAPAFAQDRTAPKVAARLVGEAGEIAPGGTLAVALEEDIAPGWHTYWVNPGAAGAPTTLDWKLPAGWTAGAIQWPYPKRLVTASLVDYGYEGKVWLLTHLTAPADAKPGTVLSLTAHATWLVCKDICIPEEADVSLPVTVSAAPAAPYATIAEQFAAARAKRPMASPWHVAYAREGETLTLFVAAPKLASARPRAAEFFPLDDGTVDDTAEQRLGFAADGIELGLKPGAKLSGALNGVLVLTSADGSVQALDVAAKAGRMPPADFAAAGMGLTLALVFAFVGGLILNLMPCVLPVLAMKALAIAGKAHKDRSEAAREGLAYGAGSVMSFAALGTAAALLRAGGEQVGWGFQLQSPVVVAGFALLLFAVGLNFSGLFELGGIGMGEALTRRGGVVGAFFTGVLAVAVAAPCTAPFMATALGYALTQSATTGLIVFLALGIGFAAPFVAIALSPPLLRLLPRPGVWMLRFREALAFPMYAAAAWLLWVLTQQTGGPGLIAALVAMIAFAFAAWVWKVSRPARPTWRGLGAIIALAALAVSLAAVAATGMGTARDPQTAIAAPAGIAAQAYSPTLLETLRQQKRPVFVDATAAWCITCLVNEKVTFSAPAVVRAFRTHHVAYLIADWTNRNADVARLLAAHGRSGVPLYLYYAPSAADAQVLPQILTEDDVLAAVGR